MASKKKLLKEKGSSPKKLPVDLQQQKQFLYVAIALGVFAFLLYCNSLKNDFILDDTNVTTANQFVKSGLSGIPDILTTEYRKGYWTFQGTLYRPLPLVVFAVLWQFFPGNPVPFHLLNCLMFALTASLIFLLLTRLLKSFSYVVPLLITFLFIIHPIHTEVVDNVKSLDELLALFFSLAACYFMVSYIERQESKQLAFMAGAYFLALCSKEGAITFLALFPLILFFFTSALKKDYLKTTAYASAPAILYLMIRGYVLSHQTGHPFNVEEIDNPLVTVTSIADKTATSFSILGKYLSMSLFPYPLSIDHTWNETPVVSWTNIRAIGSLLIYGALGVLILLRWKSKEAWVFGILFYLITISLYSNLFYTIGTIFAERLLYVPSLGVCIAFVILLVRFLPGPKETRHASLRDYKYQAAFIFSLSAIGSVYTLSRNADWKDHISIYAADVKSAPNSAHLNFWYGREIAIDATARKVGPAEMQDAYRASDKYLNRSLDIYPAYGAAYAQRAKNHLEQNMTDSAMIDYRKALKCNVSDWSAYSNFGVLLAQHNQIDSSLKYLKIAIWIDSRQATIYRNLGNVYYITNQFKDAESNYLLALQYATKEEGDIATGVRQSLADLYKRTGRSEEAKKYESP